MEIVAPLPVISGGVWTNSGTPVDTLDHRSAFWVWAARAGYNAGITFEIDVEGATAFDRNAVGCTFCGVVRRQTAIAKVAHRTLSAGIKIREDIDPSVRCLGTGGCIREV